jgi:archaellum component FlaG (FlaF/FlaG flagellin family)
MATVSIAMVYALYQNQQVIELGVKSFNMQKADFQLRNRPWLSVVGIQISGPGQNQSGHFPHFVSIQIKNIGSLPAILSKGIYRCILDDKEITNNQTALLSIASNGYRLKAGQFSLLWLYSSWAYPRIVESIILFR